MFDGRFRSRVDKGVSPIGTALGRTGLSPDHLTALGLLISVPAAIAIGTGRLGLGLLLLVASAVPDLLDGALAKANGTASKRGAFFDSVADRVTDAVILAGLAWYLQGTRHGHAALLPFAILAVSMLISYERAKAESLGFTAKGGLMERAERIILLCIGLFASVILVPLLWAMLILTSATAVQRFVKVWRQATDAIGVGGPAGVSHADGAGHLAGAGETAGAGGPAGVSGPGAGGPGAGGPVASGPGAGGSRAKPAPISARRAFARNSEADPNGAMAERWRAWRQQAAARQRGTQVAPSRPNQVTHDADRRRATRWEDRRAERHRSQAEGKDATSPVGRRHGTRRP